MKKIFSAIGKKNLIIISGILLIGIAVYLNLNLQLGGQEPDGYINQNQYGLENDEYIREYANEYANEYADGYDDAKVFGQAALVDNLNFDAEDMGSGAGETGINKISLQQNIAEENYFAVAAVSRKRARDESLELLNNIVNCAESMPDVRDMALKDIEKIANEIEKEANIEILVKAKGFLECVAVVSGENANIIVKTEGLMPNEVAQIKEIAYEQAQIIPGNVKIIEKN